MIKIKNKIVNNRLIRGFVVLSVFSVSGIFTMEGAIIGVILVCTCLFAVFLVFIGYKHLILTKDYVVIKFIVRKKIIPYEQIQCVRIQKIGVNSHVNTIEIRLSTIAYVVTLDDEDDIIGICSQLMENTCKLHFIYDRSACTDSLLEAVVSLKKAYSGLLTTSQRDW